MRTLQAVLAALMLAAAAWPSPTDAQERQSATVVGIVDGDTIRVRMDAGGPLTVRLTGIDTPETKHPSKPVQCFGVEASARTAELLPVGTIIDLERDVQETDRYGRTLAYVWPAGGSQMVNEQLVREGYALSLTIPPNVRYAESFSSAQAAAREAGAGLWSGCSDGPHEAADDAVVADEATLPAAPAPPAVVVPPVPTATSAPTPDPKPQDAPAASGSCHPSYPDFCIPPPPPDINCNSPVIAGRKNFRVVGADVHRLDQGGIPGIACESR
jgi:micrococcal nuclease